MESTFKLSADRLSCSFQLSSPPAPFSTPLHVVLKRFAEGKLLVVLTDGKKFGNVVSVQCQRVTHQEGDEGDEELSRMMMLEALMMKGEGGFDDLDEMDRVNAGEKGKEH